MINDDGILSLREITRRDLLSLFSNIKYAMTNSSIQIVKLLYLRKFFELKYISIGKKIDKLIYNYTSSKTKLKVVPTYINNKPLSNEDIIIVQNEIKKVVPSFDIRKLEMEMDPQYLIEQYDKNEVFAYEKIVIFRSIQEYISREKHIKLLFDNSIYRFATGLFHVSDELLFDFCINDSNRIPSFIIQIIDSYMIEIKNKLEIS